MPDFSTLYPPSVLSSSYTSPVAAIVAPPRVIATLRPNRSLAWLAELVSTAVAVWLSALFPGPSLRWFVGQPVLGSSQTTTAPGQSCMFGDRLWQNSAICEIPPAPATTVLPSSSSATLEPTCRQSVLLIAPACAPTDRRAARSSLTIWLSRPSSCVQPVVGSWNTVTAPMSRTVKLLNG